MRVEGFLLFSLWAVLALVVNAEPEPEFPEPAIEARAVNPVQTYQRCLTTYASTSTRLVSTYTTIKPLTTWSVVAVVTTRVNVYTYTSPWRTVLYTRYLPSKTTITYSTLYINQTVWSGTTTRTRYGTRTNWVFSTLPLTGVATRTISPATYLVPTPRGFTAVLKDPANLPIPGRGEGLKRKRDAMPEPAPAPAPAPPKSYPKVVGCTKTLRTTVGVTSTTTFGWRTVSVRPTTTIYVYDTRFGIETIHYTPSNRRTITSTITTASTVWKTKTVTSTTSVYTYTSTKLVTLPTPTYWAACGEDNRAPPDQVSFNYASVAQLSGSMISFPTNGSAYDCCVACHSRPASQGKCIGSFWRYRGCFWNCDETGCWDECGLTHPLNPLADCYLLLGGTAGTCRRNNFRIDDWRIDYPGVPSNGPGCALWKRVP